MLKKSVFLIAGLALASNAFAAKAKVLYSSERTAMYKYAFPEGQSQIKETNKGKHNWMNIKLKEVICTSRDGDRFWRLPEVVIRGNNIK